MKTLLLAATLAISPFAFASAEPPHEWQYLEGDWKFESAGGISADVNWKSTAKGNAIIGIWSGTTADSSELVGWRPDKKAIVSSGFGSAGNYWHAEYTDITRVRCIGTGLIRLSDGTTLNGNITMTRVAEDKATGSLVGKNADGQPASFTWTWTRRGNQ